MLPEREAFFILKRDKLFVCLVYKIKKVRTQNAKR